MFTSQCSSKFQIFFIHEIQNCYLFFFKKGWLFEDFLPRSLVDRFTCSALLGARARALKKIQKKQQEAEQQKKD